MKRVVTALFLVPIAVYSALFAPWWILFAVVAIVATSLLPRVRGDHRIVRAAGICGGNSDPDRAASMRLILLIVLSTLAAMCLTLFGGQSWKGLRAGSRAGARHRLYFWFVEDRDILLHDDRIPNWLMFGLMVNWIGDTGAYLRGEEFRPAQARAFDQSGQELGGRGGVGW